MINDSTKDAYRKLAKHFYLTRINGSPTQKKIKGALIIAAIDYRPNYWRRLKNAINFDQQEKGYIETGKAISKLINPLTTPEKFNSKQIKSKQRRIKKVSPEDLSKITTQLLLKRDPLLESALILATILGCRPTEMTSIEILDSNLVRIIGAKKRAAGDRSLDRLINLPSKHLAKVNYALNIFKKETKEITHRSIRSPIPHLLERRLSTITKRLWPRKKHRPTLYSLRHQLGSDLKKSRLSREEVAYIMGHLATKSADVYGDPRSGSARSIKTGISENELKKLIKSNHLTAPGITQDKFISSDALPYNNKSY